MESAATIVELPISKISVKKEEILRTGSLPKLNELEASIKHDGILEPLLVTPGENGEYILVAGHRRLMAAKSLDLDAVPVRVINAEGDRHLRIALVENLQRVDMNPMDRAIAIRRLMQQSNQNQTEIAKLLGVTSAYVSQHLGLMALPTDVQSKVKLDKLDFTHARELCRLPEELIGKYAEDAMNFTADELHAKVEHALSKLEDKGNTKKKTKSEVTPKKSASDYYREVEFTPVKKEDLRELLVQYGTKREKASDEEKRQEYTLILKGLTLAAALRLR